MGGCGGENRVPKKVLLCILQQYPCYLKWTKVISMYRYLLTKLQVAWPLLLLFQFLTAGALCFPSVLLFQTKQGQSKNIFLVFLPCADTIKTAPSTIMGTGSPSLK